MEKFSFDIGTALWNTVLIGLAGFFIKRWISSIDEKIKHICLNQKDIYEILRVHEAKISVLEDRTYR